MRQNLLEVLRHLVEKELTQNAGLDQQEVAGANRKIALDSVAYRVLVAEDNLINQDVVKTILEKNGHQVEVVGTGIKVLEKLKTSQYDLVLMDVQMPEMDGMTATAEIRKGLEGTKNPDIPIVALTANAMQGNQQQYLKAGMNDYLSKPVDQKELLSKVKLWGSRRRATSPITEDIQMKKQPSETKDTVETVKVIDFDGLLARVVDDAAVAVRLLDKMEKKIDDDVSEINAAIFEHEGEQVEFLAHRLKSGAGNLSAEPLRASLAKLESLGRSEKWGEIISSFNVVKREAAKFKLEATRIIQEKTSGV